MNWGVNLLYMIEGKSHPLKMSDNIKTGMNDNLSTVIEGVSQKRENLLQKSNFPQLNIMDVY